ncbi:ATP-binding domain-containing protein [Streptomyces sp. WMMC897]|uniref:ATP-binding domain-containing protein n=1 Tax=Streptomyces sp. WMMC897 TaxID=3014782 RepID=UPI0022B6FA60|nr:ATP-binding domain-containing protein [Streptomyces sp. WMMC897]MCZ7413432.1 ATP-binding domain-containing protein [Streptomyces sp. WMMC897]
MAAVRAVESGEKSAAEFYAAPEPAPARRPAAPGSGPGPAGGTRPGSLAAGPVAVPDALREVLVAGGAPEALAVPVVLVLGPQAADELREDPWRLLAVPGVRPEQADAFAAALGAAEAGPGEPRRARALAGWLLEGAARAGHTVLPFESVAKGLARYGVPAPDEAVRDAVDAGAVLVFQGEPESADGAEGHAGAAAPSEPSEPGAAAGEDAGEAVPLLLGLERWAVAEEALADGLQRLVGTFGPPGDEEAAAWSAAAEAAPSPSAAELIRAAEGHAVVTHTGAEAARAEPAALVAAAAAAGLRACLATHGESSRLQAAALLATGPTDEPDAGDGAAAGEEGPAVVTVTGLLSGAEGPVREADGTFALDVLAVVDAPLLDTETAAALVESLPDGARLVLSGDPHVLGAAGPGQVPADVAAAAIGPRVVSRTPDPGPLGELVSGIGVGELNRVETPGKELVIVPVREPAEAVHRTVQLVADSVPRTFGLRPEDVQVITPAHAGGAGTEALNAALKERFNPGPGRFGGFDPGDRVICSPTPGRPVFATVTGADEEGLRLAGPKGPFPVARERVATTVRHAWAVTAHQAAGARWPAVVVVLPGDAAGALDRRWVYTAFGRAERHLSVVHGVADALPRAVAERPGPERTTRLRALLRPRPDPTAGGGAAGGLG